VRPGSSSSTSVPLGALGPSIPPRDFPQNYTSFSIGCSRRNRGERALNRADAVAKMRADARSDIVASARRSPLAPNARSCASRSANAFVERSLRKLNIVSSSPPRRRGELSEIKKASRVSRKRALSVDALEDSAHRAGRSCGSHRASGSAHLRQPDDLEGHFARRRSWLCGPASRRVC
jgi:hypothetical protein